MLYKFNCSSQALQLFLFKSSFTTIYIQIKLYNFTRWNSNEGLIFHAIYLRTFCKENSIEQISTFYALTTFDSTFESKKGGGLGDLGEKERIDFHKH